MKSIVTHFLQHKEKSVPILSFPATQLLGISIRELISSPDMQAKGMKAIAQRCGIGASLNMMDLSVEAEAFGAIIRVDTDEIPTVEKGVINDISVADNIVVPQIGAGRTGLYIEGVRKAKEQIAEIPVFCGVIGPYSLAGRLFDMTELMMECYDNPDEVHMLLAKATAFIKEYIKAFKNAGADGVIMAEPAAGLLSPALADEFSMPYVQEIFDEVNDNDFVICYHNCGNAVSDMMPSVAQLHADIFHFGNAVDLQKAMEVMPEDKLVMGNVDPVLLRYGTRDEVRSAVKKVFAGFAHYENFMISTGCDVPAAAKWENIDVYFETIKELYAQN